MPRHPRKPLPTALKGAAFTVAQGNSIGLGQGRLRGGDLARPFHGIRVTDRDESLLLTEEQELRERCTALLVALPVGAFFSHVTAARLWPLHLPPPAPKESLHVGVRFPTRSPRRTGVVGHHIHDGSVAVAHRRGLPFVDPATLFCQLASTLSLPDLVAVGDALVLEPVYSDWRDERPWVPLGQLTERVENYRGRGKVRAARALGLIRPGAESRPETLVRLALIEAGLPEPEVNVEVRDGAGRFIGRGDLVYRRFRVVVEYDGDQHRTSAAQFDRDVRRLDDFAASGWRVVRIVARHFFADREACLSRVARALREAGWNG